MSRHVDRHSRLSKVSAQAPTVGVVCGLVLTVVALFLVVETSGSTNAQDPGGDSSSSASSEPSETPTIAPPQQVVKAGKPLKQIAVSVGPTVFRVSSYNILGASHSAPGGRHARFASAGARLPWALDLLNGANVSVAGFQEFQPEQISMFSAIAPSWDIYPGPGYDRQSGANSIVYRTDVWEFLEGNLINLPYFGGSPVGMPYIKLRHRESGQDVWFFNTHSPADAHGPAGRWRSAALYQHIQLVEQLRSTGLPVIFTGDMNDREEYFCPLTTQTEMHAANGGSTGTSCAPPDRMDVDWIFGSADVAWSYFSSNHSGLAARTSDHPMVSAEATIEANLVPITER